MLGWDLGIARIIAAIIFSVVIGLIMAFIYRKERSKTDVDVFSNLEKDSDAKGIWQQLAFIGTLIGILVFAAAKNWIVMGIFFIILALILWRWFKKGEIVQWLKETLHFTRLIIPWLLVGVFIAGILTYLIPQEWVVDYVGGNTVSGNFIASIFGTVMYFATLTEVPIIRAFMDMGMGKARRWHCYWLALHYPCHR